MLSYILLKKETWRKEIFQLRLGIFSSIYMFERASNKQKSLRIHLALFNGELCMNNTYIHSSLTMLLLQKSYTLSLIIWIADEPNMKLHIICVQKVHWKAIFLSLSVTHKKLPVLGTTKPPCAGAWAVPCFTDQPLTWFNAPKGKQTSRILVLQI